MGVGKLPFPPPSAPSGFFIVADSISLDLFFGMSISFIMSQKRKKTQMVSPL